MKWRISAVALALATLGGCGYVGPVVPPSPQIPNAITDLSVAERGDQLIVSFTTPVRTTDNLAIRKFSDVDLRIGPAFEPFDVDAWAEKAKRSVLPLPPGNLGDEARAIPMTDDLPVADWTGKKITVMVRTSVKGEQHFSAWSNRVSVDVLPPLAPPDLTVQPTAEGYKLSWPDEGTGLEFDVFRQNPGSKTPVQIGTSEKNEYTDPTAAWDTSYTYSVVARKNAAQSLPSASKAVNSPDVFPPSVPSEVSAFASGDSIEVSWSRSPESDLAGYFVYRSAEGGPFEKQGGAVALPAYSDHKVEHGKTYRYVISAVDRKGNQSERSTPPTEALFP